MFLPFASTGTVVSSPWRRAAASTWRRMSSTSGESVCGAGPDPIGQGRGVDLDTLAGVAVALAVERLVQAELGVEDHRQQARPRPAARDRAEERRGLAGYRHPRDAHSSVRVRPHCRAKAGGSRSAVSGRSPIAWVTSIAHGSRSSGGRWKTTSTGATCCSSPRRGTERKRASLH